MSSIPQPSVALTDACSVVYNNTLYTYSASAFQSLSLSSGAKWKQLPSGESVSGGVCVGSTPADSALSGFYVVGGTTSNSTYNGLQKYTYATGSWQSIQPMTSVTQSRINHGAVYINDTDSIVVYAGSQDGVVGESTQTFNIQASSPYDVSAYESSAPPATKPMLLQWSSSQAALIGGSTTNAKVMLFSPTAGWSDSGATLAQPLAKDASLLQTVVVTGDDNSKSLYTLDLSVSPNAVSRILLIDGSGQPVANAAAATKRSTPDDDWRRALSARSSLTASDWPAYNSSLAPSVTRSNFCIASSASGMVVMAGGGGSGDDLLCVFDTRTNAWQNTTQMFAVQQKALQLSTSSVSATPTATSTSSSTSLPTTTSSEAASTTAAAAAASSSGGVSVGVVLGAVLGSVAAVGLLVAVLYLFCCRRRKQQKSNDANHSRHDSEGNSSEKDAYDYMADHYTIPRPIGGGSGKATFRAGHHAQDSQGSFSSVAILMGRVNQQRPPPSVMRNNSKETKRSSTSSVFHKGLKSTISKPIPQAMTEQSMAAAAIPQQAQFERASVGPYGRSITQLRESNQQEQDSTRRSSGWNRYWSGGSALNILGFGSGNNANAANNAHANGAGNGSASQGPSLGPSQSMSQNMNQRSGDRTTMVSDVSSRYSADQNRITQDSATVPPLEIPSMPEAKPRFQRVNSGSPTVASFNHFINNGMQGKIERSLSNGSAHSAYSSGIPASVQDSWDPTASSDKPWGANRAPSSTYSSAIGSTMAPPIGGGKKGLVPSGISKQPQLTKASTSTDMSWLNLGDSSHNV